MHTKKTTILKFNDEDEKKLQQLLDHTGTLITDTEICRSINTDDKTYQKLVNECTQLIGMKCRNLIPRKVIKKLLLKHAELQYDTKEPQIDNIEKNLNDSIKQNLICVIPNDVLRFSPNVEQFHFGDTIKCIKSEMLQSQYLGYRKQSVEIIIDPNAMLHHDHIALRTNTCFCVHVHEAHLEIARDVACWRIDAAISLLRLYSKYKLAPCEDIIDRTVLGEPEHVAYYSSCYNNVLTILPDEEKEIFSTYPNNRSYYIIRPDTQDRLNQTSFATTCDKILDPNSTKEFCQRLYKALGWMTKARVADNIAIKFLYFFTSIEALLTPKKRSTTCTKDNQCKYYDATTSTIAAYFAMTITSSIESSKALYCKIKKLYNSRSDLVHSGSYDELLDTKCDELQYYVELLCITFLNIGSQNEWDYEKIIEDLDEKIKSANIYGTKCIKGVYQN